MLNEESWRSGAVIDPTRCDTLAHIVSETAAELILTGSWRAPYQRFARAGYRGNNQDLRALQAELDRLGLSVAGATPRTVGAVDRTRPREIREWLCRYWRVPTFVILDADASRDWGWLRPHLVLTTTPAPSQLCEDGPRHTCGLTEAHAERAIELLNVLEEDGAHPEHALEFM